jgi:hypothetical protein
VGWSDEVGSLPTAEMIFDGAVLDALHRAAADTGQGGDFDDLLARADDVR